MITLREALTEYLDQRRRLGFKLLNVQQLGGQFCTWLIEKGRIDTFTIDDAVAWATDHTASPSWSGYRLSAIRPFAGYLNTTGWNVPIIPAGLLPCGDRRAAPFIYSQHDLDALLNVCPQLFGDIRIKATMRTLICLLAVTGLRISEALALTVADIDTKTNVMTVRAGKSAERVIALHPSTTAALIEFIQLPERLATQPTPTGPIFVTNKGTRYALNSIETKFHRLVRAAGLRPRGRARPRLHDLRHTFVTAHMVATYKNGGDPQRTLTLLATWLGHTKAANTYWYLTAVPELMALAAGHLEPLIVEGTAL